VIVHLLSCLDAAVPKTIPHVVQRVTVAAAVPTRLGAQVVGGELLAEFLLVFGREVRLQELRIVRFEFLDDTVGLGVGHEHEQRGLAGVDLLADRLDKVIVDADVGELAAEGSPTPRRRPFLTLGQGK